MWCGHLLIKMLGMGRDQVWMERQFWVWDLPYLWAFPTQGHIRDITDSLIEHCQDKRLDENANIQLSDEKIINVLMDLFGAVCITPLYHSYGQLA